MDLRQQLSRAGALLNSSEPERCRNLCDELLRQHPGQTHILHLRGLAFAALNRLDDAINDLEQVWTENQTNLQAAFWLGRLLRQQERYHEAIEPLEQAVKNPLLRPEACYELGKVYTRLRRTEEAIDAYRNVLAAMPEHIDAAASLAFLLERANRLSEAEEQADTCLRQEPQPALAVLTKAAIERRTNRTQQAVDRLTALLNTKLGIMNRSIAENQLAQCLEQQGSPTAALQHYRSSNLILRDKHPEGHPDHEGSYGMNTLQRYTNWLAAHPYRQWSATPRADQQPIFMVGFPRSGTTLMDQALSAHPDVEVVEEVELFDDIRKELVDDEAIENLHSVSPQLIQRAQTRYLNNLGNHRQKPSRPRVVDKLPLNLVYLFLVSRLFPESPVLFMMRDPRDACLSCFFQLFDLQGAMPYFLDLGDTVRYYDRVMQLGTMMQGQMNNPGRMTRYEVLVEDFEAEMRSVCTFLGLDWHPDIMNYRQKASERMIDTPSYQQVVKPLYTSSIQRWRRFEAETEPELALLGQWIREFDYQPT